MSRWPAWRHMVEASKREALEAVDHYNRPLADRGLEGLFRAQLNRLWHGAIISQPRTRRAHRWPPRWRSPPVATTTALESSAVVGSGGPWLS